MNAHRSPRHLVALGLGGLALAVALVAPTAPVIAAAPVTAPLAPSAPSAAAAAAETGPGGRASAGGQNTCEVRADATLWCAGDNAWGQVGNGAKGDVPRAVQVGGAEWASVSSGGATTCAIKLTTQLFCWGHNTRGQLGIGDKPQQWRPTAVPGTGWTQVSASWLHSCGIKSDGTLWCWGNNDRGELGTGTKVMKRTPARVGVLKDWTSVSAGGWHTCGLRADGVAYCWGRNDFGQLGIGSYSPKLAPAGVVTTARFASIDTSWSSTCGVTQAGAALCWGQNDQGQLGNGTEDAPSLRPAPVAGERTWQTVALGDAHACGLDTDGAAWCWGTNRYGQLGNGTKDRSLAPVRVAPNGSTFTGVDAGWMHTCAVAAEGAPQCWGNNEDGQLTRGDRANRAMPPGATRVVPRRAAAKLEPNVTITSFNVLGTNHTQPGGGATNYAPGRIRSEWIGNLVDDYGSDIVAFQELKQDQYSAIKRSMGDRYAFYPGSASAGKIVWQSVMWDTSQWEFVSARDIVVPVIGTTRPNAMVRLRSKLTGKNIWVLNVHNSSKNTPERQRERNKAVNIEVAQINAQRKRKIPVVFAGDMNERKTVFCKVTGRTDLRAVSGGSNGKGKACKPPKKMHLDWIFTSPEFKKKGFAFDRSPKVTRITDHNTLTAVATVPVKRGAAGRR